MEDKAAICGTKYLLSGTLRVGHHTQDVAFPIGNAGNVMGRAIRIDFFSYLAFGDAVTKDNLPISFELL